MQSCLDNKKIFYFKYEIYFNCFNIILLLSSFTHIGSKFKAQQLPINTLGVNKYNVNCYNLFAKKNKKKNRKQFLFLICFFYTLARIEEL